MLYEALGISEERSRRIFDWIVDLVFEGKMGLKGGAVLLRIDAARVVRAILESELSPLEKVYAAFIAGRFVEYITCQGVKVNADL